MPSRAILLILGVVPWLLLTVLQKKKSLKTLLKETCLIARVVKMLRSSIPPERRLIKRNIHSSHKVILANEILIPEDEVDLVRERLGLEVKVKERVPDGV